jgi:hypothetical protein
VDEAAAAVIAHSMDDSAAVMDAASAAVAAAAAAAAAAVDAAAAAAAPDSSAPDSSAPDSSAPAASKAWSEREVLFLHLGGSSFRLGLLLLEVAGPNAPVRQELMLPYTWDEAPPEGPKYVDLEFGARALEERVACELPQLVAAQGRQERQGGRDGAVGAAASGGGDKGGEPHEDCRQQQPRQHDQQNRELQEVLLRLRRAAGWAVGQLTRLDEVR